MQSKTILGAAAVMAALALSAGQAGAQAFPAEKAEQARAAVEECTAAGERKDEAAARPATQRATALLREWMQAEPRGVEPRRAHGQRPRAVRDPLRGHDGRRAR